MELGKIMNIMLSFFYHTLIGNSKIKELFVNAVILIINSYFYHTLMSNFLVLIVFIM